MIYIIKKKSKSDLTKQEWREIQQPVDKRGYVNEEFNDYYGARNNPLIGTERDSSERRRIIKKTINNRIEKAERENDAMETERLNKIKRNLER